MLQPTQSLSLSRSLTHTHTHTRARTNTHVHTFASIHSHINSHIHKNANPFWTPKWQQHHSNPFKAITNFHANQLDCHNAPTQTIVSLIMQSIILLSSVTSCLCRAAQPKTTTGLIPAAPYCTRMLRFKPMPATSGVPCSDPSINLS